jgi:hypothetical protein
MSGPNLIFSIAQERQPDFYLFLRQQFKDPFHTGKKLTKKDFSLIDYVGRSINRTLENYFYNPGVKKISMGAVSPEELGSARLLRSGHRVDGAGRTEAA